MLEPFYVLNLNNLLNDFFSSKRLIFNIFNNPSRPSILAQLIYVGNEFGDMETNGSSNFLPSVAYRQTFCKVHFFIFRRSQNRTIISIKIYNPGCFMFTILSWYVLCENVKCCNGTFIITSKSFKPFLH